MNLEKLFDLIHPHPQHIVATLLWLLPDVPCMEDITFILRVDVVRTFMQLMPHQFVQV